MSLAVTSFSHVQNTTPDLDQIYRERSELRADWGAATTVVSAE